VQLTAEARKDVIKQLDTEIVGLEEHIPWYEQHQWDRDVNPGWQKYCQEIIPLLKEGLRICREQRFDLYTYGELKERY
jgi:hypothetical protein